MITKSFSNSNMAMNSSNTTTTELIGWQAPPDTRGSMNIISSCLSVVALVTWASSHPAVGTSTRQRVRNTITCVLFPQLLFLLALKDLSRAALLCSALRKVPGWGKDWTLKKSFLVVKGGILARPPETPLSQETKTINYTVDHEILVRLASVGCVRYKDFPSTSEINDKSKANWFAKGITLLQLTWFTTNFFSRTMHDFKVCPLEVATMEWIIWGTPALLVWWQCPQNIAVPNYVPVIKFSAPEREPPLTSQSESAQLDTLLGNGSFFFDTDALSACVLISVVGALAMASWIVSMAFTGFSLGLSTEGKCPWLDTYDAAIVKGFLTLFVVVVYSVTEGYWVNRYYCANYVQFLVSDYPILRESEAKWCDRWLNAAAKLGLHDIIDRRHWQCTMKYWYHAYVWGLIVGGVCVLMLFRLGSAISAIASFGRTPSGVYDVPKVWVLEAIVHVGG